MKKELFLTFAISLFSSQEISIAQRSLVNDIFPEKNYKAARMLAYILPRLDLNPEQQRKFLAKYYKINSRIFEETI